MRSDIWSKIVLMQLLGNAFAPFLVKVVAEANHVRKLYGNETEVTSGATSGIHFPETSTLGFDSTRYFHDWRDETVSLKNHAVQSITNKDTDQTDVTSAATITNTDNLTTNGTCLCLNDANFRETLEYFFHSFVRPNWGKIAIVLLMVAMLVSGVFLAIYKFCKKRELKRNRTLTDSNGQSGTQNKFPTQSLHGTVQEAPTKTPIESFVGTSLPGVSSRVCNSSQILVGTEVDFSDTSKLLADPFMDQAPPAHPQDWTNQERSEDENRCFAAATYPQTHEPVMSMQSLIGAMKVLETCLWDLENSTVVVTPEMTKKFGQAFDLSGNQIATCEANAKTNTEFLVNVFKFIHNKRGRDFTPEMMVDYFKSNELRLLSQVLEAALNDKGYVLYNQ